MPGRMTFRPKENNKMGVEHSVIAEGSDGEDVGPTRWRPGSRGRHARLLCARTRQDGKGIMDFRIMVADWMCMVMAGASGLVLLSRVIWWDAYEVLLRRLI